MIQIPNLWQSRFSQVVFNFIADASETDQWPKDKLERFGEKFREGFETFSNTTQSVNGQVVTFDVSFGPPADDDGATFAELQLCRTPDWALIRDRNRETKSTPEEIASLLEYLLDLEWFISIEASYSISREMLSPHSIVAEMLGLTTRVNGEDLLLSGAKFAIRSLPNESISWFFDDCQEDDTISGNVSRRMREILRQDSLIDALALAESRLNRLILEQAESQTNGVLS